MPRTRLIFVSGKGGTGKSAVAAAIAIDHARRGRRVLAIDMIGSRGLAAHLRATSLTYRPTEVRAGLFAMEMNRSDALDEYLKLQLHVPQGAPTGPISQALSVLADTAPGVREIISIGKPIYETWKNVWDIVVVDASSLGLFQSYLRAPRTIARLVSTGGVARQADKLEGTLTDPGVTATYLVATPAELPVIETAEAITAIDRESLGPRPTVIINRFIPRSGLTERDLEHLGSGALRDAAALQLGLEKDQARWITSLDHDVRLPYLFGVHTPGEVAIKLADEIKVPL
ncbi:MAG: ArsA-related P-loop ATPase [Actinomycetota bacterium]|nr:ArsA-related P-loop ATPase [Actinomycetota bacterium]